MLKIFAIIDKLLWAFQSWVVIRKHKQMQKERDTLEKDPANWFANHFDSVRNPKPLTDSETNETNT